MSRHEQGRQHGARTVWIAAFFAMATASQATCGGDGALSTPADGAGDALADSGAGVDTQGATDGDGGGAGDVTLELEPAAGTLDRALFGEEARVVSAWVDPVQPDEDGSFTVDVSTLGPQLLLVVDGEDALRGVGLAVPGGDVRLDAEGVAATTIFLTPGVLSADGAEAQERIAQITGLDAFPAYVSALEQGLPETPLLTLTRGQGAAVEPAAACVAEYIGRYLWPVPRTGALGSKLDLDALFSVEEVSHDDSKRQIELTNLAWRMLRVVREEGLAAGTTYTPVAFGGTLMDGVSGLSWGSLLASPGTQPSGSSGAFGAPGTLSDSVDVCAGPVAYWIQGPGFAPGIADEDLPNDIAALGPAVDAWVESILAYQLLPLMGLVGGVGDDLIQSKRSTEMAKEAWERLKQVFDLKGLANDIKKVRNASASGDKLATAGALLDLTLSVAKYIGEEEIERMLTEAGIKKVGKLGLKQVIKKVTVFLAVSDFVFNSVNLVAAADVLEKLPANARVVLFDEGRVDWVEVGVGADLVVPLDGSIDLDASAYDEKNHLCWRELPWTWTIDDPDDCVKILILDPGDEVRVWGKKKGVATLTAETCGVTEEIDLHVGAQGYLANLNVPGSSIGGVASPKLPAGSYTMVVFGTYTSGRGSEAFINPPSDSPAYEYDASWEHNTDEADWVPGNLHYGELWIDLGYGSGPPGMGWRGADGKAGSFSPDHRYEGDITLFKDGVITFFIGGYHFEDNTGALEVQIFAKE